MANIDTYLAKIREAVYGEEVRGSIHDAIQAINNEVVNSDMVHLRNSLASVYSTSASYNVGDYAFYPEDGVLYRCITAISVGEAWNSSHWVAVKLGMDVEEAFETLRDQYDAKTFTISPNLYDKTNLGIKPGYYVSGSGWTDGGGDARLGTTHPMHLFAGKTYKWPSDAATIYGDNAPIACRLRNGDVVDMSNAGTESGGYYTVTINRTGWYVINIDMTKKDSFMFCYADQYPDHYVGFQEVSSAVVARNERELSSNILKKINAISPNMLNKADSRIQTTRYISASGWATFSGRNDYGASHPIFCREGITYKFHGFKNIYGDNASIMCRIDNPDDMNILSFTYGTFDTSETYVTWTCPKDGYYVYDIDRLVLDRIMFCELSYWPDKYVNYGIAAMAEDYPNVFLTYSNDGTPAHVSIADISPNMYDSSQPGTRPGYYGSANGWTDGGGDARLGTTHKIYLKAGKSYKWKGFFSIYGDQNSRTAFFLNNQEEIVSIDQKGTWTDSTKTYVILNCTRDGYYVFNIDVTIKDTFMVCEADKYPNYHADYGVLYANDNLRFDNVNLDAHPLKGKTLICDGDSICHATSDRPEGKNGWFGRLQNAQQIVGNNYGIGGGTITYISSTRHCVSRSIDSIYNDYPNVDYLILEGGTNDADLIGRFDGDIPPQNFGTWTEDDYSGNYDDTTFCGAVESMFYKSINYWPHAHIGFIVAMEMGRGASAVNRKRYFDEAVKICKKWHIPVLNLWENSGADSRLSAFWDSTEDVDGNIAAHKFYVDGQHPSSYGYNKMYPMIEAWVKSI